MANLDQRNNFISLVLLSAYNLHIETPKTNNNTRFVSNHARILSAILHGNFIVIDISS
jgi:hypothetical protein